MHVLTERHPAQRSQGQRLQSPGRGSYLSAAGAAKHTSGLWHMAGAPRSMPLPPLLLDVR